VVSKREFNEIEENKKARQGASGLKGDEGKV
jgi:hypothetical protein